MSRIGVLHEKYFEFGKNFTPFFASMSDQQAGQLLAKSNNSTYPINSFEQR